MQRAFAALLLAVLVGCGGGAPSEVVPADTTSYVETSAAETEKLLFLTSRENLDFVRDVKPWLGDRAAYFRRGAEDDFGLVFASDDDERAEAFGRRVATVGPLRASAIVDGYLVLASSRELLRIVQASSGGRALADSARLDVGTDGAPDVMMAGELLPSFEGLPPIPAEALGDDPVTLRMWNDGRVELSGLPRRPGATPSLADVPGAAWLAFASADLGEDAALAREYEQFVQIEQATGIDLVRDVLPHLGAGMFFVQGRTPAEMGGRLVDDPDLPQLFLEIGDGRVRIDGGVAPGGVAEDLDDTRAYRDAERRLGGAPTFLLVDGDGYLAARDGVKDGRRVVSVQQRG